MLNSHKQLNFWTLFIIYKQKGLKTLQSINTATQMDHKTTDIIFFLPYWDVKNPTLED